MSHKDPKSVNKPPVTRMEKSLAARQPGAVAVESAPTRVSLPGIASPIVPRSDPSAPTDSTTLPDLASVERTLTRQLELNESFLKRLQSLERVVDGAAAPPPPPPPGNTPTPADQLNGEYTELKERLRGPKSRWQYPGRQI